MSEENKLKTEQVEKWVVMAQKGDHDAFAKVYDLFVDPLYRYIFYRVSGKADAEDILENVFLKVWENLSKYSKQKSSSFSAWIFRIAHNLVVDFYRFNKDKETVSLEDYVADEREGADTTKKAKRSLNKEILNQALAHVSESHKQILILKFINQLSNKEISEILNKNEGAIRILQYRALKDLKKRLEVLGFKM
jgi:RNA polymerase sigma-70 factor (ECF subfamily)